ncbi:hypothetical protein [Mycolicibacterium rutilum]|uniref:hypothetical protein n=1 Tax=Mycolicibacterium rutilum TaxID=370526 RepID=UPI001F22CD29|nr:hypothetical protein [Mycolicibacterium rutilum]
MSKLAFYLAVVSTVVAIMSLAVSLKIFPSGQSEHATRPSTSSTSAAEPSEKHDAAIEACVGLRNFKSGVGIARGAFIDRVDRANDWESSQSLGVQGYYFSAVGAELNYMATRLGPGVPREVIDALADVRRSIVGVVDADLRREPASVSNDMVDQYSSALRAAESACEETGAG